MNKTALTLVAALTAAGLAACGTTTSSSSTPQSDFLVAFHDEVPGTSISDADLVTAGYSTCRVASAHAATSFDAVTAARAAGATLDEAAALVVGAVTYLCPEQEAWLWQ